MNIVPVGVTAPAPADPQESPRAKAIAAFMNSTAQTPPAEVIQAQADESVAASSSQEISQKDSNEVTDSGESPKVEQQSTEKAISPQYAALARKEKALRAQIQKFQAEQNAWKADQEAAKVRQAEIEQKLSILDRLEKDPWSVLNEKGVTYDQITQSALNQPSPQDQAIAKLEARIQAQQDALDRSQKAQEQAQGAQYQQALKQIEFEATQLVSSNEAFEMVKGTNSVKDVVDLIEKTYKEDGVLLSVEEAAQHVEDYLVEEALKIAKFKKIQQRLQPVAKTPVTQQQASQKSPQQSGQIKTLTNAVGTSRQLNARERALLAFEGKLGK